MTDSNNGLRILIVEDSPGDQFLVTELLRASVLKIQLLLIADTLAKAIDFLGKEDFDIILLDLTLPDSSGIDTFKNIKEPAGKTPVVILSGVTDTSIAVEAIILGAQDYHIKGEVDEKILTRAILYSIERKRNTEDKQAHPDPYIAAQKAKFDLVQSEEITKQIMHGALDAIVCINAAGKITVWNPQAEKIFGWKEEEIMGKALSETIIPLEHRARHSQGMQHYLATGKGPILNKLIEITALNRDGNLFPIELTIIPLTENDNRFFCAFVRDISERKKAEETIHLSHQRLKNAELIGKTGYWHWDIRTGKVTWSEGTYYVFGEIQGNFKENFEDFISRVLPGDREGIRQIIQQVYDNKQSATYGFWIETPLGDKRYISTTAEVILDNNGEVASMFGTTNDETIKKLTREKEKKDIERKHVLAKLNEAVSRAQAPEEIYELTLNALQEAVQADKASILLFDEHGRMRFVACRHLSGKYKHAAEGHSPWQPDEKDAKPIFIADVAKEPSLQNLLPAIHEEGICALGFIPLIHQQKLLGKFMVYFKDIHEFDEDEIQVIQNIAANVAFAISEKQSTLALKESEEKHRAFFESSMDGILLTMIDGQIIAANPAACLMFGMTENEICLAGRKGLVDPRDVRLSSLLQMRTDTSKAIGELNLVRKDGSIFPAEISSAVFTDGTGNQKTSMIIRDITERRNSETNLKRLNERYELIGKATNDALWELDLITNKVWGNETLYKLYGLNYEKDDLNDVGLYTRIHPEDSDRLKESFKNAIERSELSIVDEYRFRVGDGSYRTVVDRAYIQYDENGKPVRLLGAMQDVTEQKNTEEFLKTTRQNYISLVNTIDGIVWEADAKTFAFSFVSERAERLLGYPVRKWIEEPAFWANHIHPDDRNWAVDYCVECTQKMEPHEFEYRMVAADGHIVWLRDIVSVIIENNEPVRLRGLMVDITKQKETEAALKASEENLRQVLSSSADNFYVIDKSYRITMISQAAERDLERAWDQPVKMGTNLLDVLPADASERIKNNLIKVFNGEKVEYELHQSIGGVPEWVFVSYLPVSDGGAVVGAYIVSKDITERKMAEESMRRSESQLLASIENTPNVAVQWYNRKGEVVFWNRASENIFGWKSEQAVGKTLDQLIHTPEAAAEFVATLKRVEETGETIGPSEFSFKRRDGGNGYCVSTIFSIPSIDGEPRFVCMDVDITQRKLAEQKLKSSEERYRSLVEQASDGILVTDLQGDIIDLNSRLCSMFGYSMQEAINKNVTDFLHPDDIKGQPLRYSQLQGDQSLLLERVAVHKDGTTFNIELNTKLIGEGKALSVIRNVSERKKADRMIKESEERYRTLVEHASDPILIYSLDGKIIDYNNAFMTTLGYQKKDIENLRLFDLLFEEDLKTNPLRFGKIKKGMSVHDERRARRKDGSAIPVELNSKMMPDGNIMVIARDITDRKKAEEEILKTNARFEVLSKATSDIVWDWDILNNSIWWNDNYYSSLGINKEQEFTNIDHWYNRIHPDDLDRVRKEVEKARMDNSTLRSHEYRYAKGDGTYLYFLDRSFVMRNPDGHPYRMIGSMVDMTPIYAAQQEVKESENRLRTIYETEPECIKLLDQKGKLLDMNPAGLAMIEADDLDMVKGKTVTGIVTPPYQKAFEKLTRDVFKGQSGTLEFEIVGLKGTRRWLETHAVPMKNAVGKITSLLGVTRDVTEKRKIIQELKKNKDFQESILSALASAICVIDKNGVIISTNETWVQFAKENGAVLGAVEKDANYLLTCKNSVKSGDHYASKALKGIMRVLKREVEFFSMEYPCHSPEINRWFQMRVTVFKGDVGGAVISHLDITQRKIAEEAVRESEEKYRTLVEQAVDAIALYDAFGKILDVNTGSVKLLGYSKKELTQMFLSDVLTKEEIKENPVRYDVLQKGESTVKQRMMRRKDGSEVKTEVRSQQLPDGRFLSVIRDLTERVTAQEQIKKEKELSDSIINSLPGLFYLIDETGKEIRWNKLKEDISGYSSEEISRMENCLAFFEGSEKELVRQRIKNGFVTGSTDVEAHLVTKDGRKILFYFTGIAVEYEGKKCLIGTGIDISDRKKAEMELEESYKAIRMLTEHLQNIREDERTHIAREIHDELGQKLTVLKMDISWINKKINSKEDVVKTRMKELLGMLDETVKAVRRISSDLRPSLLDDLGLTAAMEWQLHEFEKRFSIRTSFNSPDFGTTLPEAMKTGLFRIFQESLTNVARHSRAKKVTVTLSRENGSVILSVTDDGVGFDKQNVANKKTLGILGMKERTSMIGGSYEIISKLGKGTKVVVTVPIISN